MGGEGALNSPPVDHRRGGHRRFGDDPTKIELVVLGFDVLISDLAMFLPVVIQVVCIFLSDIIGYFLSLALMVLWLFDHDFLI